MNLHSNESPQQAVTRTTYITLSQQLLRQLQMLATPSNTLTFIIKIITSCKTYTSEPGPNPNTTKMISCWRHGYSGSLRPLSVRLSNSPVSVLPSDAGVISNANSSKSDQLKNWYIGKWCCWRSDYDATEREAIYCNYCRS